MANNYLEQLVAEWYEYQAYFVRTNVHVGRRPNGGYECELDVVAFHPKTKHLVHIEPSMDSSRWSKRKNRYEKKFKAGKKYIPKLFRGFRLPTKIEQIALFGHASKKTHQTLAGGKVLLVSDLLKEIIKCIRNRPIPSDAISEDKPLLRTLQFVCQYKTQLTNELLEQ